MDLHPTLPPKGGTTNSFFEKYNKALSILRGVAQIQGMAVENAMTVFDARDPARSLF
jgi:hypothetical protein